MFSQCLVRWKCDLSRWWGDAQEHLRPVAQHRGYEGVWRSLSCPTVHRPQDPCGKNVLAFLICFGKGDMYLRSCNSNSVLSLRLTGTTFDTEAALIHQKLSGEMILWRDRYDSFMDYVATRILQLTLCPFDFWFSFWWFFFFFRIFPGPCRAGFWHWDHQTSSEISRCRNWPDYDDLLHDWWTGKFCAPWRLMYSSNGNESVSFISKRAF